MEPQIYSNSKALSTLLDTYHAIPPRPPVGRHPRSTQTLLTKHAPATLTLRTHTCYLIMVALKKNICLFNFMYMCLRIDRYHVCAGAFRFQKSYILELHTNSCEWVLRPKPILCRSSKCT